MKKKLLIVVSLSIIIIFTFSYVTANDSSIAFEQGKLLKQFFNDREIPIPDDYYSLSTRNHDYLEEFLLMQTNDLNREEAKIKAFNFQLREVALYNKANELGIKVTDEETQEYIDDSRLELETGITKDGLEVRNQKESLIDIEQIAKGLGLTIDQYWNEFSFPQVKRMLKIEKLKKMSIEEIHVENQAEKFMLHNQIWEKKVDDYVTEYELNHSKSILSFKKQLNLE